MNPTDPYRAGEARRKALGVMMQALRGREGKSIEDFAEVAGLGHMTWRRLETGEPLQTRTYAKLDKRFRLEPGTIITALETDRGMDDLAVSLRVKHPPHGGPHGGAVLAEASVAMEGGRRVEIGVRELIAAASLPAVVDGLLSRLSKIANQEGGRELLTPAETELLRAALAYSAERLSLDRDYASGRHAT